MENNCQKQKKYIFNIYQDGRLIDTLGFNDYKAAKQYYYRTWAHYDVATVPVVDGKEITLKQADELFEYARYLWEYKSVQQCNT